MSHYFAPIPFIFAIIYIVHAADRTTSVIHGVMSIVFSLILLDVSIFIWGMSK